MTEPTFKLGRRARWNAACSGQANDMKAALNSGMFPHTDEQGLVNVVSSLTSHPDLREDLMQEARIHLWRVQEQNPSQKSSWYIQNCRFHLLHYLHRGRSLDSPKRRAAQVHVDEQPEDSDHWLDHFASTDPVVEDVSARDLFQVLSGVLSERESQVLYWRAEGLGTREIAKLLDISHPTVIKHRRKIATSAEKLRLALDS